MTEENNKISEQGITALKRMFVPGSNKYFGIRKIVKNIIKEGKKSVYKKNKSHYSWCLSENDNNTINLYIYKEDKEYIIFMDAGNGPQCGIVYSCVRLEPKYFIDGIIFYDSKMVNRAEYFYNPRCELRSHYLCNFPEIENNFIVSLLYDDKKDEIITVSDFTYDDKKYNEILTKFIEKNNFDKNITKWSEEDLFYFSLKCPEFVRNK